MAVATSTSRELERQIGRLFQPPPPLVGSPGRVGVEVELFCLRGAPPELDAVSPAELDLALSADATLATEAGISFEPGGQLELSPAPADSVTGMLQRLEALLERVRRCVEGIGALPLWGGLVPYLDRDSIGLAMDTPRYRELQTHFDGIGPSGRRMMRQTAALQICLDLADGSEGRERWRLANLAAPALCAAFANSPLLEGRRTGMRSTRTAIWTAADPSRTGFDGRQADGDPRAAYRELALDAEMIPMANGRQPAPPAHSTLRDRLAEGPPLGPGELSHHLTTLFPPVRPRGYLELRFLDALPMRWMPLAVSVAAALVYEPIARHQALEVLGRGGGVETWRRAATLGPCDTVLGDRASALLELAADAAARLPAGFLPDGMASQIRGFRADQALRARCPADDLLDAVADHPEDLSPWS